MAGAAATIARAAALGDLILFLVLFEINELV
jgi:hypothetical protein